MTMTSHNMKKIAILGSTGSIGLNALDVASSLGGLIDVVALTANRNMEVLVGQIERLKPRMVAVGDERAPNDIPEDERDYYLERIYPAFGNLVPRDVASRNAKTVCDEGRGIGPTKRGVYLDFTDAINRLGEGVIRDRYGNLFDIRIP